MALEALTDSLTHLACNRVSGATLNAAAAARVIPLLKPNSKIRPIACGTILRRIIASAITKHVTPTIATTIRAHQYAIGRPGGAEELHKFTQVSLDRDANAAILSIDVQAAFSDIEQSKIIAAIQKHHPELEPLMRPLLTAHAKYTCNLPGQESLTLTSPRGVPMGCPLAAAAVALALHTALDQAAADLNDMGLTAFITAYMDDINILINHEHLSTAHAVIGRNLALLGLQLNANKTECWINPRAVPYSVDYQRSTANQAPGRS